jgi:very-short-patch-repair endonuclease
MSAGQKFKCEICGKEFKAITNSHLKRHDTTAIEYKLQYPDAILGNFNRFDKWRHSKANKINCMSMTKQVYASTRLKEKRRASVIKATKTDLYRKKQSALMTNIYQKNPTAYINARKRSPTAWMKKSNIERWELLYGKEIALEKQKSWSKKNKLPNNSKDTKPEREFASLLNLNNIKYEKQKPVMKYRCDFYIPRYNLIVEIDGDYWHANPKKYNENDLIGPAKKTASSIWESDKNKTSDILKEGYGILRYWASDLKNITHEKVFEDIVHASMKVEE